jgi:hypothetical protein
MGKQITEEMVVTGIEAFCSERDNAVGKDGARALFKNFRLVDELKAVFRAGLEFFAAGQFEEAHKKVSEARKWLQGNLRRYALNSLEGFFAPQIEDLKLRNIEEDILAGVEKKKKTFEMALMFLEVDAKSNMDNASTAYWELLESIESAPKEQKRRDEHRVRLANEDLSRKQREKIAARKLRDQQDADRNRQRQRELLEAGKANREKFVAELLNEL